MTRTRTNISRTRATATPPPTPAAMAAEDWPEEEEEGWSVEGIGALEVGRGLVAVEISKELGTVSAKEPCKVIEASEELG